MLVMPGAAALSRFRLDKLLAALQAIDPSVHSVAAYYSHFVDLSGELSPEDVRVLARLLESDVAPALPSGSVHLVVTPRPGTISPWSTKATDIAHVCGLSAVRRIERGTVFVLQTANALATETVSRLAALLHDRDPWPLCR